MVKWNIITQLIVYYVILTIVIYILSDYMMYPMPKASYQDSPIPQFPKIIKLQTDDGKNISALHLDNPTATYTLLFSHGNGEDLGSILPLLKALQQIGFSVFAYDYHGYGTSEGSPSEYNTYLDIKAAYRYLTENLNLSPQKIILYGRSIGTGPTLELAQHTPIGGVILEAPMVTAFRVLTIVPIFPLDKYRNNQKIQLVKAPILIIHGTKDRVIPIWHGQQLFQLAATPFKRFYAVEGASHNDVMWVGGRAYLQTILSFAASLSKPDSSNRW